MGSDQPGKWLERLGENGGSGDDLIPLLSLQFRREALRIILVAIGHPAGRFDALCRHVMSRTFQFPQWRHLGHTHFSATLEAPIAKKSDKATINILLKLLPISLRTVLVSDNCRER